MKISEMFSEFSASITNSFVEELKKEDPKELDKLSRLFNNFVEVGVHLMRENKDFRIQFARIHTEFLKYPECKEAIQASLDAYKKQKSELW